MEPPPPPPQHRGPPRQHSYVDVIDAPSPQLGRRLGQLLHGLEADDFLSEERTTQFRPAVQSLVNTVVGGGTLSLAYSFHAAGTVVGIVLLALICLATDFTLFALISASRRTGAKSYEGVMLAAFGRPAQVVCTLLVFVITFLTPVAYLILLRGLLTPIIEAYIHTHSPLSPLAKHLVIGAIALAVTPLSTFNMGFIGSLAVLSMAAILVLAAVVGLRGYECMLDNGSPSLPAVGVDHFGILSSVPIYVSSFLCHFNVLPVYSELRRPTRERAHNIVHFTMATTLALYLFVGLMGYAYAECRSGTVPDNLLNAFPPDDPLVNVARAALAVVLCFCFPLLLMPCRDSFLRLLGMAFPAACAACVDDADASPPRPALSPASARTPLLAPHEQAAEEGEGGGGSEAYGAVISGGKGGQGGGGVGGPSSSSSSMERPLPSITASSSLGSASPSHSSSNNSSSSPQRQRRQPPRRTATGGPWAAASCLQRLLVTYLLVLVVIALAVLLDSVALVWAVIGSFGCITVGFIFPPLAYLKVGCRQQRLKRLWAWAILCVGAVLLVLCVAQTVYTLAAT